MEYKAESKSVQISPRKARLVASVIRNVSVKVALSRLAGAEKRGASVLEKTLRSALANAVHNGKAEAEKLMVKSVEIGEGQAMKRFHPSSRGRVHPYKRRRSHVRIVLSEVTK